MTEVQRTSVAIPINSTNLSSTSPNNYAAVQIPKPMIGNAMLSARAPPVLSPSQPRTIHTKLDNLSPVNQNGSYEFDRRLKSGYVEKRGRKTKTWKRIYLVLRPNELSIYKDANEEKLRHKIALGDLTAVAYLKDKKQKRDNIFGLFASARNWHLMAPSAQDAREWVELIRQQARIEEEELDHMLLSSPGGHLNNNYVGFERQMTNMNRSAAVQGGEKTIKSSPEPIDATAGPPTMTRTSMGRRTSHVDYSGNEMASQSDMSDFEPTHHLPFGASTVSIPIPEGEEPSSFTYQPPPTPNRPILPSKNPSQGSNNHETILSDPERVVYHGFLLHLRSHNGIKAWKESWLVLRPKNIALYKDESEYSPRLIIDFSTVIDVVEIDAISRSKRFCMQVITDEKSYRFCAPNESELDKVLGAFKSLIAKRDGRAAAANAGI